jgi:hypothetical protein
MMFRSETLPGKTCAVVLALACLLGGQDALAQERPLPFVDEDGEEKATMYQRVLTRPNAPRLDGPGGAEVGTYRPFEPLYVYRRDGDFLHVGPSATLGPEAWIADASAVEWRQNIVAAFTNPAGRSRQLMFESEDLLIEFMNEESLLDLQPMLLEETDTYLEEAALEAEPGERPEVMADAGINSVEPMEHIDIRENFYLLPILDFTEDFHPLNFDDNIRLKVASLPLAPPSGLAARRPEDFDVGIVFVIDTTSSMRPYIERTFEVVRTLVGHLSDLDLDGKVNFGIVGFRDYAGDVEGLEYRVEQILPLERRTDQSPVIAALDSTEEAVVSSPGFNEDSLTAIDFALEEIDWEGGGEPYGGRYIMLITDAGPKLPMVSPVYEHTSEDLQAAAEDKGIGILTFHLQTSSGGEINHEFARSQYEILSSFGDNTFYYPVTGGAPALFAEQAEFVTKVLKDDILERAGREREFSEDEAGTGLLDLGYAMQLAYLGKVLGTTAPDVFEAWISEFAVEDPRKRAVDFRLLITKNELATMAELVEEFIALGEALETDEDVETFHEQIREMIVRVASNPERIVDPSAEGVGDAMEFLEDLPYRSAILRISIDEWMESAVDRRETLDGLRSKLRRYQRLLTADTEWVSLFDGAPDGESVTAMPIRFLP